jgi:hypothetical protein
MGMVMYHILFRLAPFEKTPLVTKEIIDQVRQHNLKPILESTLPEEKPVFCFFFNLIILNFTVSRSNGTMLAT